jgi:hypothetical protein
VPLWALRQDPADRGALRLMASIKARRNPFLGLWWRYATWMGSLGEGRAIVVLLGMYVVYRLGTITATEWGSSDIAGRLAGVRRLHLVRAGDLPALAGARAGAGAARPGRLR